MKGLIGQARNSSKGQARVFQAKAICVLGEHGDVRARACKLALFPEPPSWSSTARKVMVTWGLFLPGTLAGGSE